MIKNPRVAFVNVPYSLFDKNRKGGKHPTMGIALLAGDILDQGLTDKVRIFDGSFFDSFEQLVDDIREFNPDVLGVPCFTDSMPDAVKLIQTLDEVPIKIAGGPYATARPEEVLENVDVVFSGESELAMRKFLELLRAGEVSPESLSEIKGIVYRNGQDVVKTGRPDVIHDLDTTSFRGRELVADNFNQYRIARYRHLSQNFISLMTSRGCQSSCAFCCSRLMHGLGYRFRSIEHVEAEIELIERLREERGLVPLEAIKFDDDDIFARSLDDFVALFEILDRRGLSSTAFASAKAVTEDKIRAASEYGLKSVFVGVETHEARREGLLVGEKGKTTDEEFARVAEFFRKYGVKTAAGYIIGFPHEREEDIALTTEAMVKLPFDYPTMSILTTHPGTALWKEQQRDRERYRDLQDGPFVRVDRERWSGDPVGLPSPHPTYSKADLLEFKQGAYREAYNDGVRILKLMESARTPEEARMSFLAFKDFYDLIK